MPNNSRRGILSGLFAILIIVLGIGGAIRYRQNSGLKTEALIERSDSLNQTEKELLVLRPALLQSYSKSDPDARLLKGEARTPSGIDTSFVFRVILAPVDTSSHGYLYTEGSTGPYRNNQRTWIYVAEPRARAWIARGEAKIEINQ